jgi:hypothetical protein
MKKFSTTTILALQCTLCLYGNEPSLDMVSNAKKNPNNIYFGPEVFALNVNSHFNHVKVHGTKFFMGLRLGYEYLKPEFFYFGIDLLSAAANHGFHEKYKEYYIPQINGWIGFGAFELRFGYTFSPNRWLLTPFLCLGAYDFGGGPHHHRFDNGFSYLGGGIHSRYEVSRAFNVGLNLKIFSSMYHEEKFRFLGVKKTTHNGLWGGEIGVPLIWRIGSHKRWDIQLEPYFLKLDFSEVQNAYGLRLLFDFCF